MSDLTPRQQVIVDLLAQGPRTGRELAEACGYDPDSAAARSYVGITLRRLASRGYETENTHRGGSHRGSLYRMRRSRRCQHPGCITLLSSDNPGHYCRRHASDHEPYLEPLDVLIIGLERDCEIAALASRLQLPLFADQETARAVAS